MIHRRNTYQSGADRMLWDKAWHSSSPLTKLNIGDVLRVKNLDTGEVVDWTVTQLPIQLNPEDAKVEWEKYPFGETKWASKYKYFPYVVWDLQKI